MEVILKQRLIGAAVIIALAVVLVPMILDGAGKHQRPIITEVPRYVSSKTHKRIQVAHKVSPVPEETLEPGQYGYYNSNDSGKASGNRKTADSGKQTKKSVMNTVTRQGRPPQRYDADEEPVEPPSRVKIIRSEESDNQYQDDYSDISDEDYDRERRNVPDRLAWTVQVASFRNRINADLLKERLSRAGFNAYIQHSRSYPGRRLYRVRVGPEPDRRSARALLFRVKRMVQLNGYITRYR